MNEAYKINGPEQQEGNNALSLQDQVNHYTREIQRVSAELERRLQDLKKAEAPDALQQKIATSITNLKNALGGIGKNTSTENLKRAITAVEARDLTPLNQAIEQYESTMNNANASIRQIVGVTEGNRKPVGAPRIATNQVATGVPAENPPLDKPVTEKNRKDGRNQNQPLSPTEGGQTPETPEHVKTSFLNHLERDLLAFVHALPEDMRNALPDGYMDRTMNALRVKIQDVAPGEAAAKDAPLLAALKTTLQTINFGLPSLRDSKDPQVQEIRRNFMDHITQNGVGSYQGVAAMETSRPASTTEAKEAAEIPTTLLNTLKEAQKSAEKITIPKIGKKEAIAGFRDAIANNLSNGYTFLGPVAYGSALKNAGELGVGIQVQPSLEQVMQEPNGDPVLLYGPDGTTVVGMQLDKKYNDVAIMRREPGSSYQSLPIKQEDLSALKEAMGNPETLQTLRKELGGFLAIDSNANPPQLIISYPSPSPMVRPSSQERSPQSAVRQAARRTTPPRVTPQGQSPRGNTAPSRPAPTPSKAPEGTSSAPRPAPRDLNLPSGPTTPNTPITRSTPDPMTGVAPDWDPRNNR